MMLASHIIVGQGGRRWFWIPEWLLRSSCSSRQDLFLYFAVWPCRAEDCSLPSLSLSLLHSLVLFLFLPRLPSTSARLPPPSRSSRFPVQCGRVRQSHRLARSSLSGAEAFSTACLCRRPFSHPRAPGGQRRSHGAIGSPSFLRRSSLGIVGSSFVHRAPSGRRVALPCPAAAAGSRALGACGGSSGVLSSREVAAGTADPAGTPAEAEARPTPLPSLRESASPRRRVSIDRDDIATGTASVMIVKEGAAEYPKCLAASTPGNVLGVFVSGRVCRGELDMPPL